MTSPQKCKPCMAIVQAKKVTPPASGHTELLLAQDRNGRPVRQAEIPPPVRLWLLFSHITSTLNDSHTHPKLFPSPASMWGKPPPLIPTQDWQAGKVVQAAGQKDKIPRLDFPFSRGGLAFLESKPIAWGKRPGRIRISGQNQAMQSWLLSHSFVPPAARLPGLIDTKYTELWLTLWERMSPDVMSL